MPLYRGQGVRKADTSGANLLQSPVSGTTSTARLIKKVTCEISGETRIKFQIR
jgi:hypothetical protein